MPLPSCDDELQVLSSLATDFWPGEKLLSATTPAVCSRPELPWPWSPPSEELFAPRWASFSEGSVLGSVDLLGGSREDEPSCSTSRFEFDVFSMESTGPCLFPFDTALTSFPVLLPDAGVPPFAATEGSWLVAPLPVFPLPLVCAGYPVAPAWACPPEPSPGWAGACCVCSGRAASGSSLTLTLRPLWGLPPPRQQEPHGSRPATKPQNSGTQYFLDNIYSGEQKNETFGRTFVNHNHAFRTDGGGYLNKSIIFSPYAIQTAIARAVWRVECWQVNWSGLSVALFG